MKTTVLLKVLCILLMLSALTSNLFALKIQERTRASKKDPSIITKEIFATSTIGVDHGFAVTYQQKGGYGQPLNKQGFQLGYVPTGNWYQGGFIRNIVVNGKPVQLLKSKYPEVIKVISNTAEKTVLGTAFETQAGELRITMTLQKDKYYSYVKIEFAKPVKNLEFDLLNHPEHYNKKQMQRVIQTAKLALMMSGNFTCASGKDEQGWAMYEDKYHGTFGPCALMYQPEQTEQVTYSTYAGYQITTRIKMKQDRNSAHFLFWHFPKKQFPRQMPYDYLKNQAEKLQKELKALSSAKKERNASDDVAFYEMKKLKQAPVIDGKMNDAVWNNVPWSDSFYYMGTPDKADPKTNFKLAYDDAYLYFFVKCMEPDVKSIIRNGKGRDFNIGQDDYVEMFICPYGELDDYYQFIINSNGAVWDSKVKNPLREVSWNSNITLKTLIGKDAWYVEGKIPVKDLVRPDRKTISLWLFNMSRQRVASSTKANPDHKWTSWSKLPIKNANTTASFNILSDFEAPFANRPIAFMAADSYKELYRQKQTIQCTFPREELFIANNLYAPNFVKIRDQRFKYKNFLSGSSAHRKKEEWKQYIDSLRIHIKMPAGCTLMTGEIGCRSMFEAKQTGKNQYVIRPLRLDKDNSLNRITHGYFDYIALYMKSTLPEGAKGEIEIHVEQTIKNEKLVTGVVKYPFTVIRYPEVKQLRRFVINMWPDIYLLFVPDYAQKIKALGFNSIPLRWDWVEYNHKRYPGAKSKKLEQRVLDMAADARKHGLLVCVHDSTMGEFYSARKEGRWGNTKFMDPGYTGKVYQKELADLKEIAEKLNPDHLLIDCEYFAHHQQFKEKDIYAWKEGKERIEKSGLTLKGYLSSCGDRLAKDVQNALYIPGKRRTQVGFYGTGGCFYLPHVRFPGREMFDLIFNIHTLFEKKLVDYAMPSPYHSGEMDDKYILCLSELRKNIKDQPIFTWAAAGYPVAFSKEMVRDQFLETCAFGCVGIAYYDESAWDVGAYWYQALAINEIAPFEDIFMDGKFYEQKEKNYKSAHIKGMIKDKEALLLFSCYKRYKSTTERIKNPLAVDCEVYDASTGKKLGKLRKGESIQVELDMTRNTKLLYFGNNWNKRK